MAPLINAGTAASALAGEAFVKLTSDPGEITHVCVSTELSLITSRSYVLTAPKGCAALDGKLNTAVVAPFLTKTFAALCFKNEAVSLKICQSVATTFASASGERNSCGTFSVFELVMPLL